MRRLDPGAQFGLLFPTAPYLLLALFCLTILATPLCAQTETARLSGQITDPAGRVVPRAEIKVVKLDTGVSSEATSNEEGIYSVNGLIPGRYRVTVHKDGFREVIIDGLVLNVQEVVAQNVHLEVGSVAESVTVTAEGNHINTTDASVSTVVDRQFAENLPLNGRSFQSLIELTPGVVPTANNGYDTGQFSINGQRADANYWTVDGVSANIGIGASLTPGSGVAGTLGSTSVLGGTNSLVSVDALQEFRIQTSTYAPEFGRTPGGQISIVTRSGTNQFHGTAFDYLRNTVFDANNWFNGVNILNPTPLPKAPEQQNDFGGVFGGPIVKDRTFFFFSYEGLRLRLPQTTLTDVPDASFTPGTTNSRQNAIAALQPYLNAFPLPNRTSPEILCDPTTNPTCPPSGATGYAAFNATYSNPATLDAYSLRVDHKINEKLNLFGRYNYSPSELAQRGSGGSALSVVSPTTTNTQTATVGASWAISPVAANDFRFNYSRTEASSSSYLDNFGGAVPVGMLPFPSPFTAGDALLNFYIISLGTNSSLAAGDSANNQQRQFNIVDNISVQKGAHSLKFGLDYRRLSPHFGPFAYGQVPEFSGMPAAEAGTPDYGAYVYSSLPATFLFHNLGVFAQDTWHVTRRLTMTYGLRWDVDFVPSSISGPDFPAVTGFNLSDLSNLALAPAGTPLYKTKWGNFAPRTGLAYQLSQSLGWQTVLRGGFGVFYDLASSEVGNIADSSYYPFGTFAVLNGINFPLSPTNAAPPPILPPTASNPVLLNAFDPDLGLPYTLQWNFSVEQALGQQQSATVSYVGAAGRSLVQTTNVFFLNPGPFYGVRLVTNDGTSDYDALQLQFQRRLSRGLQVLASYAWSHSIDTASAGSVANSPSGPNPNINRGSSDFDVRNAFSMALTYEVPAPKSNAFAKAILQGWSTENIIQAHSAPPVNVYNELDDFLSNGFASNERPDVVAGVPLYLYGSQYPGGKAINNTPGAVAGGCPDGSPSVGPFCPPPLDPTTGFPIRQGDLPRNALRGFGLTQWDFAIHREFPIHESLKLQFRAEMFNVLNHPNFGPPVSDLSGFSGQFGLSNQMLGQSLAGSPGENNLGSGAFDPLYQLGGPRSIQFALKLSF
jgi:carboxypeptidase family protein